MKFLRVQALLIVVLLCSAMSMQMSAVGMPQRTLKSWWRWESMPMHTEWMPQKTLQSWWRSTYFTDYLPQSVQSLIPRARIRQMFHGVVMYYAKLSELCCDRAEMNKLVDDYNAWMQQYKDIINEGTFLSGQSIARGNPDSVLGLWQTIFRSIYEWGSKGGWVHGVLSYSSKTAAYLLREIKKIIKNLENMGAKVNPSEEATLDFISYLKKTEHL